MYAAPLDTPRLHVDAIRGASELPIRPIEMPSTTRPGTPRPWPARCSGSGVEVGASLAAATTVRLPRRTKAASAAAPLFTQFALIRSSLPRVRAPPEAPGRPGLGRAELRRPAPARRPTARARCDVATDGPRTAWKPGHASRAAPRPRRT